MKYTEMSKEELLTEKEALCARYSGFSKMGIRMDISRGKPSSEQLCLSEGLLTAVSQSEDTAFDGVDCRNYGVPDGLSGIKTLFSNLLDIPTENMIVGGVSSLSMMFDTVARYMIFGSHTGSAPWASIPNRKFLCPCPGYDRHFSISETFGFQLIPIAMTDDGPNMDEVEKWVNNDASVKGIWCVPKYSNPTGITYSDETVRRFAALTPAAEDFRIFWDNAYIVHDMYDEGDRLLNLFAELKKQGKEDMLYTVASFSKVTYPGGSVAVLATGEKNLAFDKKIIGKQLICNDKVNQLRHLVFFKDADGVRAHMKKHAELLRPKFEMVERVFDEQLTPYGVGRWSKPKGGYFISLDLPEGTAKRTYALCKDAGLVLTNVGATFPYGHDPKDENLRIAPSYPPIEEVAPAAELLCICARLAAVEKLLAE